MFDGIGAAIINNKKSFNLDLIDKSLKKTYKKILEEDNNIKKDLNNNIISKSIYIFF